MIDQNCARERLSEVRRALQPVLEDIGHKLHVDLTVGGGQYSPSGAITLQVRGTVDGALDAAGKRYQERREQLGLPRLYTQYEYDGSMWAITGLLGNSRVRVRRRDGLVISLGATTLRQRLRCGAHQLLDREVEALERKQP